MAGPANGALHQPCAVAFCRHALLVHLLHIERHKQIAQRVDADHWYLDIAIGFGNPAQAVAAHAVGVRRSREFLGAGIDGG